MSEPNLPLTKKCFACKEIKSLDFFYRDRCNTTGWHSYCAICLSLKTREWVKNNPGKVKKYREANKESHKRKMKELRDVSRLACLSYYSNGLMVCECCKESHTQFLCLDHINGGGNKHRKNYGGSFFRQLVKQRFPEGLRVLCYNCNMAYGLYGTCPHQKVRDNG